MQLNWFDLTTFCAFIIFVVGVSLYMGRKEETDEDYFLAGRGLSWWLIGILAGLYTTYGGLKAVVWSDLIQGIALLLGGAIITILGFQQIGGWEAFTDAAGDKLHTVLPWDHPEMPWVAIFIGGLWIPNLFCWGLNQFVVQRTLGAKSLAEGQRGIFLAAGLKLVIPFIIVFPGIMAAELYPDQMLWQIRHIPLSGISRYDA